MKVRRESARPSAGRSDHAVEVDRGLSAPGDEADAERAETRAVE